MEELRKNVNTETEDSRLGNKWNSILISMVITLSAVLLLHLFIEAGVNKLRRIANEPTLVKETEEINRLGKERMKLRNSLGMYIQQNKGIVHLYSEYFLTANNLRFISNVISSKVWMHEFSINIHEKICIITGRSFNTRYVSELMLELKKIRFFSDVELISMGKVQGDAEEAEFKIRCSVK